MGSCGARHVPRQGDGAADAQYPPFWTACGSSVDVGVELGDDSVSVLWLCLRRWQSWVRAKVGAWAWAVL